MCLFVFLFFFLFIAIRYTKSVAQGVRLQGHRRLDVRVFGFRLPGATRVRHRERDRQEARPQEAHESEREKEGKYECLVNAHACRVKVVRNGHHVFKRLESEVNEQTKILRRDE